MIRISIDVKTLLFLGHFHMLSFDLASQYVGQFARRWDSAFLRFRCVLSRNVNLTLAVKLLPVHRQLLR